MAFFPPLFQSLQVGGEWFLFSACKPKQEIRLVCAVWEERLSLPFISNSGKF